MTSEERQRILREGYKTLARTAPLAEASADRGQDPFAERREWRVPPPEPPKEPERMTGATIVRTVQPWVEERLTQEREATLRSSPKRLARSTSSPAALNVRARKWIASSKRSRDRVGIVNGAVDLPNPIAPKSRVMN